MARWSTQSGNITEVRKVRKCDITKVSNVRKCDITRVRKVYEIFYKKID